MAPRSDGVLARFARDLTADARDGRLEPVRCRADEISRVIDILLRHGKNNPALVGPAGVGKTAIIEGLAQRLAAGDVPLSLRGTRILAVDHVSLLAGTTYRGDYEERIRRLVAETSASPDVILFIDELHNLIGQGTALGVAMDAGNMLKPALVRGDFRVIGATTNDEYERWVCGDPALERRFQRVLVRELSADETLDILRARLERLERHHNVVITDTAVRAAVELTDRYQTDRMRPDRAIDALDEACAHAHAVAVYSEAAQSLIRRRRTLLSGRPERSGERAAPPRTEPPYEPSHRDDLEDDPIERMARDGFAALERFGAEIEAMFVPANGSREPAAAPSNGAATSSPPQSATSEPGPARAEPATLAELEAELHRVLVEEGVVVRGHDVARVVKVATSKDVTWTE
ncbi:MAG: ATPase central domain protein [Geminicoccaceae bacterium]|jgi:ATP-dependent Clp protease ATP-binding subunit ClpA|nr:ATPase central domain protein [Geminicoccaceae bacterium]